MEPSSGILHEWIHSQIAQHQPYGGVVPDLASREHLRNFPVLLAYCLEKLSEKPTAIAVTRGPGLAGCLGLGIALAKALAAYWECPLLGINHLRGHAFSPFIPVWQKNPQSFDHWFQSQLPHLGLIVSGGNTLLVKLDTDRTLSLLAQTVDDAAGEALDKGAKLLGMPYPGGPQIEKAAQEGIEDRFSFPVAFSDSPELRFSFSGLKTSLRYRLEKITDAELSTQLPDLCASYQHAVIEALLLKTSQALRTEGPFKSLGLSGGVSNNSLLREKMARLAAKFKVPILCCERKHSGDNAGMIAFTAWIDEAHSKKDPLLQLGFEPSLSVID
jgi:N6-L-threonylcarbamoyladenine synthase